MSQKPAPDEEDAKRARRAELRSFLLSALFLAAIMFTLLAARIALDYQFNKESFAPQWRSPLGLTAFFGVIGVISLLVGLFSAWIERQPWATRDRATRATIAEWRDSKNDDWVDWIIRIIAILIGLAGLVFILWLEEALRR